MTGETGETIGEEAVTEGAVEEEDNSAASCER